MYPNRDDVKLLALLSAPETFDFEVNIKLADNYSMPSDSFTIVLVCLQFQ